MSEIQRKIDFDNRAWIDRQFGSVRKLEGNAWVRDVPGGWLHLAGADDTTPQHLNDYNSDCGWCWLGHGHTQAAHAEAIA